MVFLIFEVFISKYEDMRDFDGSCRGFIQDEVISVVHYMAVLVCTKGSFKDSCVCLLCIG